MSKKTDYKRLWKNEHKARLEIQKVWMAADEVIRGYQSLIEEIVSGNISLEEIKKEFSKLNRGAK